MRSLLILAVLGIVFVSPALFGETRACAHRGDQTCAPENTIPAFESAVRKGAPMIEFDVQRTHDGQLIIMHDPTVNRTTNGKGLVKDMTFEEIRRLDAGSWFHAAFAGTPVPTLEEALAVIPDAILCNVHLKGDIALGAQTARVLETNNRLQNCFLACTVELAEKAREAVPAIRICNMSREDGDRDKYIASTIALGTQFIQLHKNGGTDGLAEDVLRLKAAGITVNWFGASEEPLIKLLAGAGVDYILTDDLDICLAVLAANQKKDGATSK